MIQYQRIKRIQYNKNIQKKSKYPQILENVFKENRAEKIKMTIGDKKYEFKTK